MPDPLLNIYYYLKAGSTGVPPGRRRWEAGDHHWRNLGGTRGDGEANAQSLFILFELLLSLALAVAGLLLELGGLRWLWPSTTENVTRRAPLGVWQLSTSATNRRVLLRLCPR